MSRAILLLSTCAALAAVEDALPPSWAGSTLCHRAFDGADNASADAGVEIELDEDGAIDDGFIGGAWRVSRADGGTGLDLSGLAFTSGKPLTVMAWWKLDRPPPKAWSISFIGLSGSGRMEFFVRDGGPDNWCGLTEPTGVFQIYVPGITNVNDIWSANRLALATPPVGWHHTALSVGRQGADLFWDGELVQHYGFKGRELTAGDLKAATIGPLVQWHTALIVDEVTVLGRMLPADEVADYVRSSRALRKRVHPGE